MPKSSDVSSAESQITGIDVTSFKEAAKSVRGTADQADVRYRIHGGKRLEGTVDIGGSKNAALPLMAGAVASGGVTVFKNVPSLRDTRTMIAILNFLGATTKVEGTTVTIDASALVNRPIPHELVSKLRGCIVFLGPLLARFGEVEMSYPGGCVLGKRPVGTHIDALVQMGAVDLSTDEKLHLKGKLRPSHVVLPEFSVTVTENVVLAASILDGETTVELAAAEPHVQDVCRFVQARGRAVDGIGSHTLTIHGKKDLLPSGEHTVTSDYLEAGIFILAGIVTRGLVRVRNADATHLTSFLGALKRAGAAVNVEANGDIVANGEKSDLNAVRIQTNIFPGFPTDLQAPFGVLLTQAKGVSRIFEVLFDGRMAYLYELEKMGATIEILNSHEAIVIGPSSLSGRTVASNDIRAGAAMVLAGLIAKGETVITDVRYIERGYDRLEEKLRALGADMVREAA